MTHDDISATLARIFPGDPVPDVTEETYWSDEPNEPVAWRVSAPPTRVRKVESPRVKVPHATAERFRQVIERGSTTPTRATAPSVPTRAYLLDDPANVQRWLAEAHALESDAKLGQAVEPHHATRLLLEALPVMETFKT